MAISEGHELIVTLANTPRSDIFKAANNRAVITEEFIRAACAELPHHLTIASMCGALGVKTSTFKYWVRSGDLPGCPDPMKQELARRIKAADAAFQRECVDQLRELIREKGDPGVQLKFIQKRWGKGPEVTEFEEVQNMPSDSASIEQVMADPPPELLDILHRTRVLRHLLTADSVQDPDVLALLGELGFTKVPAKVPG